MRCCETQTWTFQTLVGAFLDLSIAFLVLCCSLLTFLTSKFLSLFDLCLDCPCQTGLFGEPNDQRCHLVSVPIHKIKSVQTSVKIRSPFDSMWVVGSEGKGRSFEKEYDQVEEEEGDSCGSRLRFSVSFTNSGGTRRGSSTTPMSSSSRRLSVSSRKRFDFDGGRSEADRIRIPKRALEDEQTNQLKLRIELEKERSAAATAAEEAMAMIERVQKEKAAVEMNARQYQRIMEEKSCYDEEEMEILKEIICRRERELFVLETEVNTYRKTTVGNVEMEEENDDGTSAILQKICESIRKNEKVRLSNGWLDFSPYVTEKGEDNQMGFLEKVVSVDVCKKLNRTLESDFHQEDSCLLDHEQIKPNSDIKIVEGHCGNSDTNLDKESEAFDVHVVANKNVRKDLGGCSLEQNSPLSPTDNGKIQLKTEVEGLARRLEIVQQGRQKLNMPVDVDVEKGSNIHLQLLQEIAFQIKEIRQLTRAGRFTRQASLPPSTRVNSEKRRCRSVTSGGSWHYETSKLSQEQQWQEVGFTSAEEIAILFLS